MAFPHLRIEVIQVRTVDVFLFFRDDRIMSEKRWTVFVLDSIAEHAIEALQRSCHVRRPDDPNIMQWPEHADAIITRTHPVSAEEISRAAKIKVIAKHGIGVDHINLDAARRKGVPVINTPGTNAQSVAELTVMFAIATARKTRAAEAALRTGNPGDTMNWKGFEISGRRVGIVGFGNVGRKTAPIFAHGFGCTVSAYDPYLEATVFSEAGVKHYHDLHEMLCETDILCMHTPLNEETKGLIGATEIALLPPGSVVVNCARGGIVDEAALYKALDTRHLAGAGSDVFVQEPPPDDHPLFTLPNFVSTPHIGAATVDSARRSGDTVVRHVLHILEGGMPETSVL